MSNNTDADDNNSQDLTSPRSTQSEPYFTMAEDTAPLHREGNDDLRRPTQTRQTIDVPTDTATTTPTKMNNPNAGDAAEVRDAAATERVAAMVRSKDRPPTQKNQR